MKKIKEIFKKFTMILITIIMIFGNLPLAVFADAEYITDMDESAEFGVISSSKNDYGHEMHYAKYDNKTYLTFCCQFGKNSPNGREYKLDEDFYIELKNDRKYFQKIAEMIYFGYVMEYGTGLPTSTNAKKAMCATQQYVWEYIKNNVNDEYGAPARNSWNSKYMSNSIYKEWLEETEEFYELYHGKDVSFSGKTKKVELGETKTFTDTNGMLKGYASFDKIINGVTFKHTKGSNDLIVTVPSDCTATNIKFKSYDYDIYQLMPNGDSFNSKKMSTYMYFRFKGAVQNLLFSSYVDPSAFTINIGVESGDIKLTKTDNNDTPLKGCTFRIYEDEKCTQKVAQATTDENGEILFDSMGAGDFWIKEVKVPTGYLLDDTVKKVTVKNGETAEVSFKNDEPTGKLFVYKVDSTGTKVGGAKFKVTAGENITNASKSKTYYNKGDEVAIITSNEETGIATKSSLPLGKYLVQEIENVPEGYLLNSKVYTADIKYKNSTTSVVNYEIKDVVNKEPTGNITIKKVDKDLKELKRFDETYEHGDASIEGTVYKLYANEDIYNVSQSLKYFSKDEEIAEFTFDKKGEATTKITNTKTKANLNIENNKTITGLPVRKILCFRKNSGRWI